MLELKRLSPAGIGPERLLLETSTNRSSGWEKSGRQPSKRLLASESSSSRGEVMDPGTGPENSLKARCSLRRPRMGRKVPSGMTPERRFRDR